MDILVPIMIVLTLGLAGLAVIAGFWLALARLRARGPSGLVPQGIVGAWSRFWFTPRDPTILGLMRIACGAITTYTVIAYSFTLQEHMGADSWYHLALRDQIRYYKANIVGPLTTPMGSDFNVPVPHTLQEKQWLQEYHVTFGVNPPEPSPRDADEANILRDFKASFGMDLRYYGLRPPRTDDEKFYVDEYMLHAANVFKRPPPAYIDFAADRKVRLAVGASIGGLLVGQGSFPALAGFFPRKTEREDIYQFMASHVGLDPRSCYSMGQPSWSIWFHVTDPATMNVIHTVCIVIAFAFTIGLCTRVTSFLTWMTALWYIHRSHIQLFGVDTMMVILLFYLMIGPSGTALSVDRLISRWWARAKPSVLNHWRRMLGRESLSASAVLPAAYSAAPAPSVPANFAIRLLQIHVCVIYFVSGVTKLLGPAWWNGTAVWGTLANFEFAPMAFKIGDTYAYTEFLRFLGKNHFLFESFLTATCIFTLAFEIAYAFLVWRPSLRWVFLSGAIILHGFIGLLMGLKTFSLMMLVLNMAFLTRDEADAFLRLCRRCVGSSSSEAGDKCQCMTQSGRKGAPEPVVATAALKD